MLVLTIHRLKSVDVLYLISFDRCFEGYLDGYILAHKKDFRLDASLEKIRTHQTPKANERDLTSSRDLQMCFNIK